MKFTSTIAAALLFAVPGFAQTVTELLQKGIYAQETSGNLDEAILIYRQIVNSASGQRDIAAQAQYRLADTYIRKGDLTNAASEFQKLARDYPDQQTLISRLALRQPERGKVISISENQIIVGETTKFLEAQVENLKREIFRAERQSQVALTPEQRFEMDRMKARLAELAATLSKAQLAELFEESKRAAQGKSK